METSNNTNPNLLPTCMIYAQYLQIASIRFNLAIDECRNRFGLYTNRQWDNLFQENEQFSQYGKIVGSRLVYATKQDIIDFNPGSDSRIFDLDVKANSGELERQDFDKLNYWFKQNKDKVLRTYHATSAEHDILKQGLLTTCRKRAKSLQSGYGYVYVSYDPMRAKTFGEFAYPNKTIKIYAVEIPISELKPDKDQLKNKRLWGNNPDIGETLADSLLYGGGFRIKRKIEPYELSEYNQNK